MRIEIESVTGDVPSISLRGVVIGSDDGEPVIGAFVEVGNQHTQTDIQGQFMLKGLSWTDEVHFEYIGYCPVTASVDVLDRARVVVSPCQARYTSALLADAP